MMCLLAIQRGWWGFLRLHLQWGFYHMGFFLPYFSVEISCMKYTFWFIGVLAGEFDTEA